MHGDGGAAMSAVADVRAALMGHLKDVRLPAVRECYEDTARRAERETLSYEQYLLEVISRECGATSTIVTGAMVSSLASTSRIGSTVIAPSDRKSTRLNSSH